MTVKQGPASAGPFFLSDKKLSTVAATGKETQFLKAKLELLFFAAPQERCGHADALDGLRGLAVSIVLLSHLSGAGMPLLNGLNFSGSGKSGVYLFFALSAFLLTRALAMRPLQDFTALHLWGNYMVRRVLRVWPLYLTLLVTSAVITHGWPDAGWHYPIDVDAFWAHVRLTAGSSVLWSIPVEFKYYALLPLVALGYVAIRHWRLPMWCDLLFWLVGVAVASWGWPPAQAAANDVRLGPYLVVFFTGALAAAWQVRIDQNDSKPSRRAMAALAWVAVFGWVVSLPVVLASWYGMPLDTRVNHHWYLYFGVLWSALLLAVLNGPDWLRRAFGNPVMRFLGVVSFSIYLWHMPVLGVVMSSAFAGSTVGGWVSIAGTLLVSAISYLLFERPWRDVRLARSLKAS